MTELLLVNISLFSVALLVYVTIVFVIAVVKKDNSVMDIAYGPAFVVPALLVPFFTSVPSQTATIILLCTTIWATRLASRIFKKNFGKPEDARYAAWRAEWSVRGRGYFLIRSFLQINVLQGLVVLMVSLPLLLAVSSADTKTTPLFIGLGLLVFVLGLTIESIADYQLDRFLARKKAGTEPAVLMTSGLFRFSRRPNYFGETLVWWGMAVMALPLPLGWIGIVSPLLITYIVTKVTGPMLENIFLSKYPVEYRDYMRRTNYFIPWFPKDKV